MIERTSMCEDSTALFQKKVLLLCTSHNDLGLIKALKKLGCYIIATGNRENSPGEKWVDKWIRADYSDKELILQIAREEKIDNICACCNDFGVYTAAYVAEKLGLSGYDSYETTLTLHNKDKFKQFVKENNIISPWTEWFEDVESAVKAIQEMTLPVIVKPVDCSAGNGVGVVYSRDDSLDIIERAFSASRAKRIVVEQYITGSQHGFCTYLLDKKVVAYCSNDEYSIVNPYRVEIDTFPATHWEKYYQILIDQIEKIAECLNLKDGIFHLQYIYKDGQPWIIEVMRRTVGNMYHVLGNPLNNINWEYWEARARLGMNCDDFPVHVKQEGFYAYKTILAKGNGIIKEIEIPTFYKKYVFDTFYLLEKGSRISNYKSEPIGFLFMMFGSQEEMYKVLIEDYRDDLVKIEELEGE